MSQVPVAVCEAMTAAVWVHAKAHVEKMALLATANVLGESGVVLPEPLSPSQGQKQSSPGTPRQHSTPQKPVCSPLKRKSSSPASEECAVDEMAADSQDHAALILLGAAGETSTDGILFDARVALNEALKGLGEGGVTVEIVSRLRTMAATATEYWRDMTMPANIGKAALSLAQFTGQQRELYWRRPRWRGVNLGGWLLLEPGPSASFFAEHGPAECEWSLASRMRERLGAEGASAAFRAHRESFITEIDMRRIREMGLNAVRIPFGYWAVTGTTVGEAFVGPCLEYLDKAVAWCNANDIQAVLDLHGAPGGESGERPCGRQKAGWRWQDWRFEDSIAVLRAIATRYRGNPAVAGIQVCNEPSEQVPAEVLCRFYDRAVQTIRGSGMPPDEVAILLPVYRVERLDEIWRCWCRQFDGFARHSNVVFDLHLYHCFGKWWQSQGLGQQLHMTRRHRELLRRVPAVVGEWSLALSSFARGEGSSGDRALTAFAAAQLESYRQASHGWFFWNWRDSPEHSVWDLRRCIERRWFTRNQWMD